jgi:DNA repair protein RecO (recombination protein O)
MPEEATRIVLLMRMNYETMYLFEMNRAERGRCLEVLNEYYKLHLPDFPTLKSLEVLKELFS